MAINYKEIQAGGTSTDVLLTISGMDLILEMTHYNSGVHRLNRYGDMTKEVITLLGNYGVDTKVSIYLIDDPETNVQGDITITRNEGMFVVDVCRQGIDNPYNPSSNLVMYVGDFIIPKSGIVSLDECAINTIKVVGGVI